jgi:hypothetical protein
MNTLLIVLGVFLMLAFIYALLREYGNYCAERFGYDPFGKPAFYASVCATLLFTWGYFSYTSALKANLSPGTGVVLLGLGAAIVLGLWVCNFRNTNGFHGFIGSFLQLIALPIIAGIGLLSFIGTALGIALSTPSSEPSMCEQDKRLEEWNVSDLNKDSSNYRFKNEKDSGY